MGSSTIVITVTGAVKSVHHWLLMSTFCLLCFCIRLHHRLPKYLSSNYARLEFLSTLTSIAFCSNLPIIPFICLS